MQEKQLSTTIFRRQPPPDPIQPSVLHLPGVCNETRAPILTAPVFSQILVFDHAPFGKIAERFAYELLLLARLVEVDVEGLEC